MEHEAASAAASVAAKSLATAGGAAAAFGLTPIACAAAIVGAALSLHFEEPADGRRVWRIMFQIAALAFLAAMMAGAAPSLPGFGWSLDVPVALRAGLLGLFANPVYRLGQLVIDRVRAAPEQGG